MSGAAGKSTALWVVRVLRKAGHQALFAGGCVRDMLLGLRCTDYDVATDATPEEVKRLFRHVLLVGAKFGVSMVIVDRRRVEVTTFRSDQSYSDGRRPDNVRFVTAQEDALRRDFTINGMFYDPLERRVIDYVGGQADLKGKIVRTIGNPDDRFQEDYLRMVRAVRFSVRLGFAMDLLTAQAIARHSHKVTGISGERILDEFQKMLSLSSAGEALGRLAELGLAQHMMPELFALPGLWERSLERARQAAGHRDPALLLGVVLAELPAPTGGAIIRRWGGSNEIRATVSFLAEHIHGWPKAAEAPGGEMSLADFKRLMANRDFQRLRVLWQVEECLTTGQDAGSRRIGRLSRSIPPDQVAPKPMLGGKDLKEIGLSEGPKLGRILKAVYEAQLNEQVKTRKEAFALAISMLRQKA